MDSRLYEAIITGNMTAFDEIASSDLTALLQVTTEEDNVLHAASKYNRNDMAEKIVEFPLLKSLVNQKNSKGDTPLHVAARLGSFKTAEILVNCANSVVVEAGGERVTKMVNTMNDTALHDAVRNGHRVIAELLIREDPELTSLINDVGESPLFIAVDKKYVDIAKCILDATPNLSFAGRNHMNALHAAVIRSQDEVHRLTSYMVLKRQNPMNYVTNMPFKHYFMYSSFGPSAIMQADFQNSSYNDFVANLTEKCKAALSETDELGWTPLHYAIHFGSMDSFKLFLTNTPPSSTRKRDNQGMSVIHIAAREGEVVMLGELGVILPEMWDLQDHKGQTAFHLAVERGKLDCVKFILDTKLSHDGFINQQDNEGNTAFHIAAIHRNNQKIFELLIGDLRVDKTIINMEGLTVIDIILMNESGYFEKTWVTMSVASNGGVESLEHAINKNGRKTRSTHHSITTNQQQQQQPETTSSDPARPQRILNKNPELATQRKPNSNQLEKIASTNLLVTTLIATVSFAAGFTMPGGYKSDGPEEGMAILSKKMAFRVFVIANALAFYFSTTSMFLHYFQSFEEKLDVRAFYTYLSTRLTSYGIIAMVIAFVSGTYAALANSPGLAKAVLSIGCSFFGLQLLYESRMITSLVPFIPEYHLLKMIMLKMTHQQQQC